MAKKPLYIQLEPGAYPQDTDWQIMTAEERGCYHALIIFIACNDGRISKDPKGLALLCNIKIAKLKTFLEKYSHKFIIKGEEISHKRVNDELGKARKYIKQKSLAGKKGMQRRYNTVITDPPNTVITKESKGKVRKVKERKGKKTKPKSPLDLDFSLTKESIKKLLCDEMKPETQWEINTLGTVATLCATKIDSLPNIYGFLIEIITDLKEDCKVKSKNHGDLMRMFVAKVKKELK